MADLFQISWRGVLATAFANTYVTPSEQQWEMLNGDREVTLRDIAKVGHDTGTTFEMKFVDPTQKATS